MKPDYLTLTDGRSVRILWNMNALSEYTALTGKEMMDFASGTIDVKILRSIAWCCAVEGEAADNKELKLSEVEFGRLMSMASVVSFVEIFTRQNQGSQKKSTNLFNFPLIHSRKKE